MPASMFARLLAMFIALVFFSVPKGIAFAQTPAPNYGSNLLENGNADENFGSADGKTIVKPTGWETTGTFTVVKFGAPGEFPDTSTPGATGGELNFFSGGTDAVSTATQKVNLAAYASDIDAGAVTYDLSGRLGGYGSSEDNAAVSVSFLSASGATLGTATIGPVGAGQRLFNTAFIPVDTSGSVPSGTHTAVVVVTMTRAGTGYNHATAGQLALLLQKGKP